MDVKTLEEVIEAQAQQIKCIGFSGGGAKGAIYSGAYEAMFKCGIINGLRAVAGSSAGAITAGLIATGISVEKFKKISSETNLKGLLGAGVVINKDGKPLLELMRSTICSNITDFLKDKNVLELCQQRLDDIAKQKLNIDNLTETQKKELINDLEKQEIKLQEFISSNGTKIEEIKQKALSQKGIITFKDISFMQVLAPLTFKDLVVTATKRDTGDLKIFDSRNTPDVEIALACRASASIPIIFEPVTIDGIEYVDGGYRDNVPLTHFDKSEENMAFDISGSNEELQISKKTDRTLALVFGSGMEAGANVAVYSAKEKIIDPNKLIKFLMDVVFKTLARVGGEFIYSEEENKTHERIRENALNTIVLDTKELSALSFDLAQERAQYLHVKGCMQTARHFDNHDIAPINDSNFELKDLMLKVYEGTQNKGLIEGWTNKITGRKDKNLKDILNFCNDEPWENKDSSVVISEFIKTCAKTSKDGKLMINTKSMKVLIDSLNDSFTPEVARQSFLEVIKVDPLKDTRFELNKSFSENMAKFKFTENDFKGLILEIEKQKHKANENDVAGNIIKKGKTDSFTKKVVDEKKEANLDKKGL